MHVTVGNGKLGGKRDANLAEWFEQTLTKREQLEVAMSNAEAALSNTVTASANPDMDRTEANLSIEKARAYCRQVRAALVALDRPEATTRPGG